MSIRMLWSLEVLLPGPGMSWQHFPLPQKTEELSEEEMDNVIAILKRAMPLKEFRKKGVEYDPDCATDDIPF